MVDIIAPILLIITALIGIVIAVAEWRRVLANKKRHR